MLATAATMQQDSWEGSGLTVVKKGYNQPSICCLPKVVALAAAVAAQQDNVRNKMATNKEFDRKGYNHQSWVQWKEHFLETCIALQ